MHVIVVAEDEPLIRMEVAAFLIDEGFQVREAGHAADVLKILEVEAKNVHVLFTDVQMPGDIDGLALSHHVRMHWPWIGILVTSARAILKESDLPKGGHFLPKPYRRSDLAHHVRKLTQAA